MRIIVVTPAASLVSVAEAKAHLRVDGDDEDGVISGMVAAACAHIDGPDGWLGRAIGVQTLEARFDRFDDLCRPLPLPPVVSVEAVEYLDTANVAAAWAGTGYELLGDAVFAANGTAWPAVLSRGEAVRVRYVAGYASVPPAIRAAVLLMTEDLYRNRGEVVVGSTSAQVAMSTTVAALLSPFRVWR